jgi:Ca2+-binding RTX toxin-like protein
MAVLTFSGNFDLSMDDINIGVLVLGDVVVASSTTFAISLDGEVTTFFGSGFSYAANGVPVGGIVTRVTDAYLGLQTFDITGLAVPATQFVNWALSDDNFAMEATILAGADTFYGSARTELLRGYGGDDSISGGLGSDGLDGGTGNDTISGGGGNDIIIDPDGTNYLRGDEGNDSIVGGTGFDDINGNMGNDTCVSGGGDDWVVGGKGDDSLVGSGGTNLVYGNIGNDTCDGGAGNDTVRGGQDNDVLYGGAGNDFVSGDRGDDTVTGGSGADLFHTFGEAGIDRVLDFHVAEGDRVMLDPGTRSTVAQVAADTVISMTGGATMILVGVQMGDLTGDWIFGA